MSFLMDYHIHSSFSKDSTCDMETYCKRAIELKIQEIGFAEHWEFTKSSFLYGYFNPDRYFKQIEKMRKKFKGRLNIRAGVEVGFDENSVDKIQSSLSRYNFDFVMGSVHYIGKYGVAYVPALKEYFSAHPYHVKALLPFFKKTILTIESGLFDIIGHLDFAFTVASWHYKNFERNLYHPLLLEIIELLIKKGIGIEINSGGLSETHNDTTPEAWFVKEYIKKGGKVITLGSDSHSCSELGRNIDRAIKILAPYGFKEVAIFSNRNFLIKALN